MQPVENFTQLKASITAVVNVPIMVFIDWPDQQFALGNMTTLQQVAVLTNLANKLDASGLPFVYHVYHHVPLYDSVAEGTYSTLLQLNKEGGKGSIDQAALPLPATPALVATSAISWHCNRQLLKQKAFL